MYICIYIKRKRDNFTVTYVDDRYNFFSPGHHPIRYTHIYYTFSQAIIQLCYNNNRSNWYKEREREIIAVPERVISLISIYYLLLWLVFLSVCMLFFHYDSVFIIHTALFIIIFFCFSRFAYHYPRTIWAGPFSAKQNLSKMAVEQPILVIYTSLSVSLSRPFQSFLLLRICLCKFARNIFIDHIPVPVRLFI